MQSLILKNGFKAVRNSNRIQHSNQFSITQIQRHTTIKKIHFIITYVLLSSILILCISNSHQFQQVNAQKQQYDQIFDQNDLLIQQDLLHQRILQDSEDVDEENQILQGAADQDFSGAIKNDQNQITNPAIAEQVNTIKSAIQSSANVAKTQKNEWETNDIKERFINGDIKLTLDSIVPRGGPLYGTTRVTVRAASLEDLVDAFPDPKCRFGTNNQIVDADYVKCTKGPLGFYDKEKGIDSAKNSTCIQCEASPKNDKSEIISLTVSLTGKFDDISSSQPYRYYDPLVIKGIYPRYGPKDGDTVVQVWGDNFLDMGDDFRCNFGTRSTKAHFIDENYVWCRAAPSDVVGRPMPFSISMNRQQNSLQKFEYWYYSEPQITQITPDYGPMNGGTKVTLKGSQFYPFDWKLDINNQNDTFCDWGPLGKTPAQVISSTEAECVSPENNLHLDWAPVNLTLNNQNYTDEDIRFIFYNPPQIIDAFPLKGPIKGGTEVNIWGNKYEKNKNITCFFGNFTVQARFISKSHLICPSPQVADPGVYKLIVKYENDRFQSDVMTYQYFDNPEILQPLYPSCGPIKGYTQILIRGKNFIEFGFGKAKCVFNNTYYTNATVTDANTLYCDSPPLKTSDGSMWYNVSVSLDGDQNSNSTQNFSYYDDPIIHKISPWMGPLEGGTVVNIYGKGFNQTNLCDFTVRFGQTTIYPSNIFDTNLTVNSSLAAVPGEVVVSVSGNNQQFINDITLHYMDLENTFVYYQPFIIELAEPQYLSNSGNSPLTLQGLKFNQFTYDNSSQRNVTLKCRFLDNTGKLIGPSLTDMKYVSDFTQICIAPKTSYSGNVQVQITANDQQWQDIQKNIIFFNGPKVTSISPTSGVTKNPKGLSILIYGQNFQCPQQDCSNIKVRFTNAKGDLIYVDGNLTQQGAVSCLLPKYPAPETLNVDVSFNGRDFTNDGVQFGFQDPYILNIKPRLISTQGTTQLNLYGYGFVQLDDSLLQVLMKGPTGSLSCKGSPCQKVYSVLDQNLAQVSTYPQASMMNNDGTNIGFLPFSVNMMNPDGDYSSNDIRLWYYQDPVLSNISSLFAYNNEEKPIIIQADFSWGKGNDYQLFKKYSNFTCKFQSSSDKTYNIITSALFEASPIGQYQIQQLPNQIRCITPKWNYSEQVNLQISLNGQDYFGDFQITFVDQLQILRISPLSGPLGGQTKLKLFGSGFNGSIPITNDVFVKFGSQEQQYIDKTQVNIEYWSEDDYYNQLLIPKNLLKAANENLQTLKDGQKLNTYNSVTTPDISRTFIYDNPDVLGMGGPVYVQLGEKSAISVIDHNQKSPTFNSTIIQYIETVYPDSSKQEFYFYRQPFVKKIQPTSGLTDGGTTIDITGGWFDEQPQYGVFPFCKIGDNIVKAKFIQTNRIQCIAPSSSSINAPLPIQISLNGVDFADSGFNFNYFQKPILLDVRPRSGSVEGGTEIWLKGDKFSNITNGLKTVKCRFTQIESQNNGAENTDQKSLFDTDNAPIRYIPAYFIDKETMKCASPAGWAGGDTVKIDVTFNGVDYTDNSFDFHFYNIYGSFPKSGPADAVNQFIQIRGKGFRQESIILCNYNNTQVAPISVHFNLIKCPMVLDSWPSDRYESIPFSILIDGSKYSFGNFRYYKQITIDNVTPLIGPQEGRGAIYFIGKDFRDDFENSKLGCRIGNTLGHAQLIDSETIRCTISNKLPLLDEGDSLLCSVSLNSYSWGQSDFSLKPYGIYDIYPNAGPISQNTNILVVGKGFNNDLKDFARCKFGTDDNYIIVDAQILDNEHMICKSPSEEITLPESADQQISLPFSVAFQEDLYFPFTEGPQKFRLYKHPVLTDISPSQSQIGRLTEVYITADESDGFWQPIPSPSGELNEQYGLKCKFGRFGTTQATYINKTTLLCLTPNIQEDPQYISVENVQVSVALNGIDFNDDQTTLTFQFMGTGGSISTWVIIMGTLIFGLLIVSILVFLGGLQEFMQAKAKENIPRHSYTVQDERGAPGLRVASRSSSSRLGQPRPRSFQNAGSRAGDPAGRFGGSRAGDNGARFGGSRAGGGVLGPNDLR